MSDYGVGVLLDVELLGGAFEETVEKGNATDGIADPAAVPGGGGERRARASKGKRKGLELR